MSSGAMVPRSSCVLMNLCELAMVATMEAWVSITPCRRRRGRMVVKMVVVMVVIMVVVVKMVVMVVG